MGTLKALLASFLLILPLASAGAEEGQLKETPSSTASSPVNYKALAEKFRGLAQTARENAEWHREMAASAPRGPKIKYRVIVIEHCNKIIALQEKLASEYTGLAATYEAKAKE